VYFNYGMHHLINVVTESAGRPAAVLIRALEPLEGLELMRQRRVRPGRPAPRDDDLCRGPGNLTRALGIDLGDNRADLTRRLVRGPGVWIEDRGGPRGPLTWSPRVGIRVGTDRLWRCYVRDSGFVSGKGAVGRL
jgi:DNA-3-methyladenine glycosylase